MSPQLRAFPKATSPGASKLRAQHILDAVSGTIAPAAQTCLEHLTRLMNKLLASAIDPQVAPWLSGAPLTALIKKTGGYRTIAVGEVIRRLASKLCCAAVKPQLPDLFLPYGQVGVGIKGGLEAAVHCLRKFINDNGDRSDLCCLKLDMSNAFNNCSRSAFLSRVEREVPEIFSWVQWSYHSAGEL